MILVTVLAITNLALRTLAYGDDSHSGVVVVVLSLVTAALTILGGTLGGSLVFDYGFNVETAGITPRTTSRRSTSAPATTRARSCPLG
jgi:uncharacterized membrane protein